MIRFDTAKSTTLAKVGKKGTVSYNVGWGGPALVMKGDEHTIEHNTVVGKTQIVVNFGAACGMNAKTKVAYNAENLLESRGSCKGHNSLPAATKHNFPPTAGKAENVCDLLVDCAHRDFRPKPSAKALQYAGGYIAACAPFAGKAAVVTYCGRKGLCVVETSDCSA